MVRDAKICARCGLEKPKLQFYGQKWCSSCMDAHADEIRAEKIWQGNQRRYQERKARGQCQRCNEPARPGGVFCERCARKKSQEDKAKRARG
jgi:hypothetical protein